MIDRRTSSRLERVRRVVAIGARVADGGDELGREARAGLATCSGLSREGVELALTEHLEIEPRPEELDALVASMDPAPRCHVVLAANVCVAALRAIACAVAASPIVFVRPSRRDPALASILARELSRDDAFAHAGGSIARVAQIDAAPGDDVHVYGSDESIATISASLPPGVVVRGHGSGLGIAAVEAAIDVDAAAEAIARDVIAFDQRGCLSPRAALVEGGGDRARSLAASLDRALASFGRRVPRGPIDAETAAEVTRYRRTMEAVGACHAGDEHAVGVDFEPRALILPPPARVVHVACATVETAPALLAPWADALTCVGGDDGPLARSIQAIAPLARRARLGFMQRPPLDGPVDLRRRIAVGRGVS